MTMDDLQAKLAYQFNDSNLLQQALTHKSFANENRSLGIKDNERLEFLGDAVLDLALSDILMSRGPSENEGILSKHRASLVNEDTLSTLAQELSLSELIRLGKGEETTQGRTKPRLLASTLEALIGAIFVEAGYVQSKQTVETLYAQILQLSHSEIERDHKTKFQELSQKKFGAVPVYTLIDALGPEHEKEFRIQVSVGPRVVGEGRGKSKKQAEQNAAKQALETSAKWAEVSKETV